MYMGIHNMEIPIEVDLHNIHMIFVGELIDYRLIAERHVHLVVRRTCLTIEAVDHNCCARTSLTYVFPYSTFLQFSLISITLNGPIST